MTETRGGGAVRLPETSSRADFRMVWPTVSHEVVFAGRIADTVQDTVALADGDVVREYTDHPGAVAVIAINEQDEVLLLGQYRHPVRAHLWEPPAGLLDMVGEDPLAAAQRELFEEADLHADTWYRLVEMFTTPGGSNESIVVFLALGLSDVPAEHRFVRTAEEAGMPRRWIGIDEAVGLILAGELHSPTAVTGILAAAASRQGGWSSLRHA